jgi:hypothetical protein
MSRPSQRSNWYVENCEWIREQRIFVDVEPSTPWRSRQIAAVQNQSSQQNLYFPYGL